MLLGQATGFDSRTAGGAGIIALVSPTLVRTTAAGFQNLSLISTLTLAYVPEPGTLLLLGTGLAVLGVRRRTRA